MSVFIVFAVLLTIVPMQTSEAPMMATERRPIKSEREPTNGHIPARARRFARTYGMEGISIVVSI